MLKKVKDVLLTDNLDELIADSKQNRITDICMLYCWAGKMQISLNNTEYQVEKETLLVCLPDFILEQYMRTPDFQCMVLCISAAFYREIASDCFRSEPQWLEKISYLKKHPIYHISKKQQDGLHAYYNLLTVYLPMKQDGYRGEILRSLARAAMLEGMSHLSDYIEPVELNKNDALFRRFLLLLHHGEYQHRDVNYYAQELGITPKYLSAICKSRSKRTSLDWINECTMDQARRLLFHSDMTTKAIAEQLGFNDVSYFCQFVRKHSGMTPQALRKSARN